MQTISEAAVKLARMFLRFIYRISCGFSMVCISKDRRMVLHWQIIVK
jgi:hypothetical protein